MNPNTNSSIGSPMINSNEIINISIPAGMPVGPNGNVVLLNVGISLVMAGTIPAKKVTMILINPARNNPTMKAHIAIIADCIRANGTTGILVTSIPSNSNSIPPNLGTRVL